MRTIYNIGNHGRDLLHPRWVRNVSDQDITVTYNSDQIIIAPGETIVADLSVASIFENFGVIREHDSLTGVVTSEVKALRVYDKDPGTITVDERKRPKVVIEEEPEETSSELDDLTIGELRDRASSLNITLPKSSKRVDYIKAIKKEEAQIEMERSDRSGDVE